MLLEQSAEPVNPPPCAEPVDEPGRAKLPDPHRVVWMNANGVSAFIQFPGWEAVFALIMRDGVTGLRVGTLVVLTPAHWSAQIWGRA